MAPRIVHEPLDAAIEEYIATFSGDWAEKTLIKYKAEFRDFLAWLRETRRPATTEALDFNTLLAYVVHLKQKPAVRGVWRGDRAAVRRAVERSHRPRSLNSVNSSMRCLRAFVLWLFEDGRLAANPFARKNRRGGQNPLLPRETTPTKGATLNDIQALEQGCAGRGPLDLRDQAIVSVLKTTAARNSSVRLLRVEDVDFERNVIRFVRAKADQTYDVVLLPETKAALIRYLRRGRPRLLPRYPVRGFEDIVMADDPGYLFLARDNGRGTRARVLTANGFSEMVNRRYKAGGGTLANFRSHRIRHGTATLLANNGMSIEGLAPQLGHTSTRVTARYGHRTTETIGRQTESAARASGLIGRGRRAA